MSKIIENSPLADRLSEAIVDFSQCNEVTYSDLIDALDYVIAIVEMGRIKDGELQ